MEFIIRGIALLSLNSGDLFRKILFVMALPTILFLRFVHYISGVLYVTYGLQVCTQFACMLFLYMIEVLDMIKKSYSFNDLGGFF